MIERLTLIQEPEWLFQRLTDSRVRIVDCQYDLSNEGKGRESYNEEHIPSAAYADTGGDLSSKVLEHGGRHPLPSKETFVRFMQQLGVDQDSIVIAYDGGEGAFAARFLWLSELYGYSGVYVLNGGLKAWKEQGYPVTAEIPNLPSSDYWPEEENKVLAAYEEVKALSAGKAAGVLIDSREEGRYMGLYEPIDAKCGHIPKAINYEWMGNLDDGLYLKDSQLAGRFADIDRETSIMVYCGSGITACVNYIALKQAGYQDVKVYGGSFSDWISYDENPVETN
ncbi:sulfurtransferase [Pradoshia sp.]|uniref:sulfurtransferase n=1 Tax=Pradoshia sp. TaxID=2651281 RepID=UPI003F0C6347